MKNISEATFITEMRNISAELYRRGYSVRNGGSISFMLEEKEAEAVLGGSWIKRTIPIGFTAKTLAGKYFVVTGKGTYFRNAHDNPARELGIIRILEDGATAALLWGYEDGGTFTSELAAHLISHAARLSVDPRNRVILHCHPTNTMAMHFVHALDDKKFTRSLWGMCTEGIAAFPEGVGVLPQMLCGTTEIGEATAEKMKEFRAVILGVHGVYAAGKTIDETFGLVETVEKAAQIYMLTAHLDRINTMQDAEMARIAEHCGANYRKDFLDL